MTKNKYIIELIENGRRIIHTDPLTNHYNISCGVSAIEVIRGGFGGHEHYLYKISETIDPGVMKSGMITLDLSKGIEIPCNCLDTPNDHNRRTNLDFNTLSIK